MKNSEIFGCSGQMLCDAVFEDELSDFASLLNHVEMRYLEYNAEDYTHLKRYSVRGSTRAYVSISDYAAPTRQKGVMWKAIPGRARIDVLAVNGA